MSSTTFVTAFIGTFALLLLGLGVVWLGYSFVIHIPDYVHGIWLMIGRRWFPDRVPAKYDHRPPGT